MVRLAVREAGWEVVKQSYVVVEKKKKAPGHEKQYRGEEIYTLELIWPRFKSFMQLFSYGSIGKLINLFEAMLYNRSNNTYLPQDCCKG